MSGFLAPPCIARCVGGMLAACRWTAGGALARTGDPRAGVVYDRIWSGSILPLGQLRQAACSEAELFFLGVAFSPPICACGLRPQG